MGTNNLFGPNVILSNDSNNYDDQDDAVFNFSLNVAYEIILKSQQSDVLFPEVEIVLIVVYVVLIISGVVSNVLVCFVVMRQCARKKMDLQKSRNLYIVNLAVADLALCCICMPFTLIALIQRDWTFGSLLCKLVPVVQGTNITVSAGTITVIAMDRYNTIVKSRSSNSLHSRRGSAVMLTIFFIWLMSFTITSPLFFYTVIESVTFENFFLYEKCIEKWPSKLMHSTFTITLAVIQFVIPVLVLSVIHLKISSYLKFHIKPLRESKPEIHIHSPNDGKTKAAEENNSVDKGEEKAEEDASKKELLYINRKESTGSENLNRSYERQHDLSRKNSESSRKNSDSSRNSCELSPRKKSDLFMTFRENSDFYGFSFSRFSDKSKSNKSQKRREIRRNRRSTFILSCIALVYAVSWLPMTIFQISSIVLPPEDQNPKTIYIVFAICHIIAMSSAISNPLLYGWLNANFRREFTTIFSCISNFYSKILRSDFNSPSDRKKGTAAIVKAPKKLGEDELFAFISHPEVPFGDHHSVERNLSLNYKKGKLNSNLVGTTMPIRNSQIENV